MSVFVLSHQDNTCQTLKINNAVCFTAVLRKSLKTSKRELSFGVYINLSDTTSVEVSIA